ncbi:hypothetical protein EYF80_042841 [Liparis tanakae]|uniref:Uncharacterized protein n=1 Tax=Liparis tanakae TaxID=230148 RepID=A0A4Z2G1C5_9TELE|nr:hypothetical protein EYF80_042841 [Liparis tanakae]
MVKDDSALRGGVPESVAMTLRDDSVVSGLIEDRRVVVDVRHNHLQGHGAHPSGRSPIEGLQDHGVDWSSSASVAGSRENRVPTAVCSGIFRTAFFLGNAGAWSLMSLTVIDTSTAARRRDDARGFVDVEVVADARALVVRDEVEAPDFAGRQAGADVAHDGPGRLLLVQLELQGSEDGGGLDENEEGA